ncbi:hypothetical protein BDB01DRAFT_789372 [Pilobolus umbonatus]|nr:hypothetical protein BDB01DRAFT_789372 [Pilobolus umbonatus]
MTKSIQKDSKKNNHNSNKKKIKKKGKPIFNKELLKQGWEKKRQIGCTLSQDMNTCYYNAVLQCFNYTPQLAQYLMEHHKKSECTKYEKDGFCGLCAVKDITHRCVWKERNTSKNIVVHPSSIGHNLKIISSNFRRGRQEDAHEFFLAMLAAMQKGATHHLGKLTPKQEETSLIYQIYGGKQRSQLTCYSCHAKSNTFESFLDLSVDINKVDTLQEALNNFVKVDIIGADKENRYNCDACKNKVKAGKKTTIDRLPMVLPIHLKRFNFNPHRGSMRKLNTQIQYPEILDMAPYVSEGKEPESTKYRLFAVLVHLGSHCESGHYISFVNAPDGSWYEMDDDVKTRVSLKTVLNQKAYMLFYKSMEETPSNGLIREDSFEKRAEKEEEDYEAWMARVVEEDLAKRLTKTKKEKRRVTIVPPVSKPTFKLSKKLQRKLIRRSFNNGWQVEDISA